jgi:hypothetical protein
MPTKAKKSTAQDLDKTNACIHLKSLNTVSNSLQPLCECVKRDLILGKTAVICSVCEFYKKTSSTIGEMYLADELGEEDILWNDEDFYDVIKEREVTGDTFDFEESTELYTDEDEEDEEEEEEEKPKRKRKKKTKKKDEEDDDDDIVIEKETEEEEKISEELFGGTDDEEEQELEVEDETVEVEKEFEEKKRAMKEDGEIDDEDDFEFDDVDDGEGEDSEDEGTSIPEIEITPDGKERCPYCQKEFGSVSRHISRCKRAPPGAAEALRKKLKKTKKKSTKK